MRRPADFYAFVPYSRVKITKLGGPAKVG